jgi:hypothetical protein
MSRTMFEDDLGMLTEICKFGLTIEINPHKGNYQTVQEHLDQIERDGKDDPISAEMRATMIRVDRIVKIHFYPDTPVAHCTVLNAFVEHAVDDALSYFNDNEET